MNRKSLGTNIWSVSILPCAEHQKRERLTDGTHLVLTERDGVITSVERLMYRVNNFVKGLRPRYSCQMNLIHTKFECL